MMSLIPSQTEFILEVGQSQAGRILDYLRARRGKWVPMPELWQISGAMAVHSRIADLNRELRGTGDHIFNRVDRNQKPYESFYMLTDEKPF